MCRFVIGEEHLYGIIEKFSVQMVWVCLQMCLHYARNVWLFDVKRKHKTHVRKFGKEKKNSLDLPTLVFHTSVLRSTCGVPSKSVCVCLICTCVSGEHRGLGPNISKVRSLKMDRKVWTEDLIQVHTHIIGCNFSWCELYSFYFSVNLLWVRGWKMLIKSVNRSRSYNRWGMTKG